MKKVVIAIFPLILLAQIRFNASSYIPTEWIKSVQYGLKWTELMVNGYPGAAVEAQVNEPIPEGVVTTTVVMTAALADIEEVQLRYEQDFCEAEVQQLIQHAKGRRIVVHRTNLLL